MELILQNLTTLRPKQGTVNKPPQYSAQRKSRKKCWPHLRQNEVQCVCRNNVPCSAEKATSRDVPSTHCAVLYAQFFGFPSGLMMKVGVVRQCQSRRKRKSEKFKGCVGRVGCDSSSIRTLQSYWHSRLKYAGSPPLLLE